jgi:3'(2'), 5'-bisphosphate nucleotidase
VLYDTHTEMMASYTYRLAGNLPEFEEFFENSEVLVPNKDKKVLKVVGSKSHSNEAIIAFVEGLKNKTDREIEIESLGSSLKFCLVFSGLCEIYAHFEPTIEWDTAAGQAICEAAGLQVLNAKTQEPLQYNKEDLHHPFFIVSR